MKKVITMLFVCLSMAAMAQSKSVFQQIVNDCKVSQKTVTQIDRDLFDLYLKNRNVESKEALEKVLKGVDNLNVLQFVVQKPKQQLALLDDMKRSYEKGGWKLFKEGVDANSQSYIVLKKDQQKIGGIAYMGTELDRVSLLEFLGNDIQVAHIAQLSNLMNLQGVEKLSKLTKDKKNFVKMQPNGVKVKIKGMPDANKGKKPLVIIDDVVSTNEQLQAIDPAQIKSVSVLKDAASTALYPGGENGVILILTKGKGKAKSSDIRSQNKPLYVVDGVLTSSEASELIDPNEIDSIQVFKGEKATTLYGSKGAHGVILITTKKNKKK